MAALAPKAELADGYSVLGHLRRGRALDVYEVWSEDRGCVCVAKVLRPDHLDDRSSRRRLLREGRLLLRLSHPYIVRAYELCERPAPVLVLETLPGETLEFLVKDRVRRLPVVDLALLGLHLCSAIGYLHRHRYLHLDLKPSNVVTDAGFAKVIDLSVARPPGRVGKPVGTRVYMAPEQASGGMLTEATDVWGLGIVLYEGASGQRPFRGARQEVQLRKRAEPVRSLRRMPAVLAETIDACLEPDPAARPDVADIEAVLEPLAESE
jgi:serine/threonine protein kinase